MPERSLGTLAYCGQRAAVCADGRAVRDLVSSVTFRTTIEWMNLAGQTLITPDGSPRTLVHVPAHQPVYCVFGCGFTASWGLEGCAPGCGGVKNMCFKCFVEAHSPVEVATAQLLNDIHLSGPFGPHFCKPCHERGYPSGQHYCDPRDRSEGWDAAVYCLENLIGYNAAHGLPGIGNALGTYTKARTLLPPDHPTLATAEELIKRLQPAESADAELEAERAARASQLALDHFYAAEQASEEEEEEEEDDVERMVRLATEAVAFDELGAGVATAAELDDDALAAELARIERIGAAREEAQLRRALGGSVDEAASAAASAAALTAAATAATTAATALAEASAEDADRFALWVARIEAELQQLAALDAAAAAAAKAPDAGAVPQQGAASASDADAVLREARKRVARKRDLLVERAMLEEEIATLARGSSAGL